MYIVLIVIHIIVCFILILTILLQAGRGGGLTESLGGDTTQSVLGTQAPVLLKRTTEISAIVFLITSLLLGVVSTGKNRSLLNQMRMPDLPKGVYTSSMEGDMTTSASGENASPLSKGGDTGLPSAQDNFPVEK